MSESATDGLRGGCVALRKEQIERIRDDKYPAGRFASMAGHHGADAFMRELCDLALKALAETEEKLYTLQDIEIHSGIAATAMRAATLEEAAKECDREASLWKSSRIPEPDDVSGGKSAAFNCAIAIRALKGNAAPQVGSPARAAGGHVETDSLGDQVEPVTNANRPALSPAESASRCEQRRKP